MSTKVGSDSRPSFFFKRKLFSTPMLERPDLMNETRFESFKENMSVVGHLKTKAIHSSRLSRLSDTITRSLRVKKKRLSAGFGRDKVKSGVYVFREDNFDKKCNKLDSSLAGSFFKHNESCSGGSGLNQSLRAPICFFDEDGSEPSFRQESDQSTVLSLSRLEGSSGEGTSEPFRPRRRSMHYSARERNSGGSCWSINSQSDNLFFKSSPASSKFTRLSSRLSRRSSHHEDRSTTPLANISTDTSFRRRSDTLSQTREFGNPLSPCVEPEESPSSNARLSRRRKHSVSISSPSFGVRPEPEGATAEDLAQLDILSPKKPRLAKKRNNSVIAKPPSGLDRTRRASPCPKPPPSNSSETSAPPPLPPRATSSGSSSHGMDALNVTLRAGGVRHHQDRLQEAARQPGRRQTSRPMHRLPGHRASLNITFSGNMSLPVVEEPALSSNHKLIASSVNNVSGQPAAQPHIEAQGRVASWAVHIDRLLHDPIGVNIFTEFLQKEFSEENILFWQACQQYRLIHDEAKRMSESAALWTRFLSPTADDPVNVDSSAKSAAEKYLDNPTPNMFDVAQRQIYQLMRQDSYSRFIKSDMYKGRVMKEMEGKPLEGGEGRGEGGKTVKAAKLTKNKSENRRRSILPWRQNKKGSIKTKSDSELKGSGKVSKDEAEKDSTPATTSITTPNNNNIHNASNASSGSNGVTTVSTSTGKISKGSSSNSLNSNNNNNNNNVPNHKKTAGPGIDLSTMRKEVFHPRESRDAPPSHFKFCRIVMPDGSTTVVCAKPGQSSRTVLGKLCEKRSVSLAAMDVFLLGSDQPLDLSEDISTLGSKEIVIERRVLFRLDLPSGKCIGVKAKPNRSIREVFRPILSKYGLRMDAVAIHLLDSPVPVDQDTAVSDIDNKRVIVVEEGSGSQKRRGPFFGLIRPSEKRVSGVKAKSQEQTEQGQGHLCPKD